MCAGVEIAVRTGVKTGATNVETGVMIATTGVMIAAIDGGARATLVSFNGAILSVHREYLAASFQEMRERFGSNEVYFAKGYGIDATNPQVLRDQFASAGKHSIKEKEK